VSPGETGRPRPRGGSVVHATPGAAPGVARPTRHALAWGVPGGHKGRPRTHKGYTMAQRKARATTTTTQAATQAAPTPYPVAALPATGVQYRQCSGGTGTPQATAYTQAMRTLAAWARGTAHAPQVHALVHLGWCSGT